MVSNSLRKAAGGAARAARVFDKQRQVTRRTATVGDTQHGASAEQFVSAALGIARPLARLKILNAEVCLARSTHARSRSAIALAPATPLHAGDSLDILLPLSKSDRDKASVDRDFAQSVQDLKDAIIYRDQHILILNKPRALSVQAGSKMKTSVAELLVGLKFSNPEPPRLVHRLDKDTTGCLILARTKQAATRLADLFARAESKESENVLVKTYLAIITGKPLAETGRLTTGIVQTGDTAPFEKLTTIEWRM
ncbi:hypothetical protein HK100_011242 [Physocladia obscura]|uniref:Pseudouridine synthase RsuA/RluA-like domain-containing protein n=1 Tax=Physocladia obscura TaxID=109957 RepID=A0AAD5XEA0_9FUNG|nr:hypothetical protein HK100_011242 [Physocladia obscura]